MIKIWKDIHGHISGYFGAKKSGNTVVSLGAFNYYSIHFHLQYFKTFYIKHIIFTTAAIFFNMELIKSIKYEQVLHISHI